MSEGDWSSEARGLEKPKRRVPMWVWGCGGGCALMLLVGVILGVFVFRAGTKMMDQEANWTAIDRVLPVAERPVGYSAIGFPFKLDGVQVWMLPAADQSHQVMLFHGPGGEGTEDTRQELFGSAATGRAGAEPGTLTVQGRQLRVLRHRTVGSSGKTGGWQDQITKAFDGANLTVELSQPDSPELIALTYTRQGSVEPVADEDVIDFLEHFRLPGGTEAPQAPEEPVPPPADGEERDG
jgi:hypothetical protein